MTTRRDLLTSIPAIDTAFAIGGCVLGDGAERAQRLRAPRPVTTG
jgi:hypothetical protein